MKIFPSRFRLTSLDRSWTALFGACLLALGAQELQALDVLKANNTTTLINNGSWVGNVAPTSADYATWNNMVDGTIPAAATVDLGGNVTWGGLKVIDPAVNITIAVGTATRVGTIGSTTSGLVAVDMTAATKDLTYGNVVGQGTFRVQSASQTWLVAPGRTFTV